MIVTCVHIFVKPDKTESFLAATRENHVESVKEKGNLRFDLLRKDDDSSCFMLYEAYISEAAAAEHKKTAHYLKWKDTVAEFMAAPREGIRYSIVEPDDPAKW